MGLQGYLFSRILENGERIFLGHMARQITQYLFTSRQGTKEAGYF